MNTYPIILQESEVNMAKKILVVLLILLLTGCYNYNELNDLAIAVGLGIDKDENGYVVSLEIVNDNKDSTIYSVNGDTLDEAFSNLYSICPKKIFLSHLEVIIYGNNIDNIKDTLDFWARKKDIREDVLVFLSDKKAKDILKATTNSKTIKAFNIKDVETSTYTNLSATKLLTLNELLDTYLNPNKEIVIPIITLINKDLKIKNMAILKDTKVINYLDNTDSVNYNILTNNTKELIINTKNLSTNLNNVSTNIKVKDDLNVYINIKAKGTLIDVKKNLNLNNKEVIAELNNEIEKDIKDNINNTLNKITNSKSDIIGILDNYYKNKYKYYLNIKDDWYNNYFNKLNYHISVNVNLYDKGKSLKVIK